MRFRLRSLRCSAPTRQEFQALSAQATLFHEQFVQSLTSGAGQYAAAEAANADPLTTLVGEIQSLGLPPGPVKLLTGRPLIGNGANGAPGNRAERRRRRVADRQWRQRWVRRAGAGRWGRRVGGLVGPRR